VRATTVPLGSNTFALNTATDGLSHSLTTTTPQSQPIGATQSQPTGATQSLSTGAQAGIGVGAGVGGLALIALIGWWVFRRQRNRAQKDSDLHGELKAELDGTSKGRHEMDGSKGAAETEGKTIYEAPSKPEELEGPETRRYELEGEWRGTEVG
jgi:hypothetical protein